MPPSDRPVQVAFWVPPRVQLLDLSGPVQVFQEAEEHGAPFSLGYFGTSATERSAPRSSAGLPFGPLPAFAEWDLAPGDLIFVPGLDFALLDDRGWWTAIADFLHWLREQYERGVWICSVCTGAFVLGEAGLLDHRSATTHWKYARPFRHRFPSTTFEANRLFVRSDRLFTSAGVTAGIDLSLHLLELLQGSRLAAEIAREIVVYLRRGPEDEQLSVFLRYRNHLDERVHRVQDYLQQHLGEAPTIPELAARVHTSPRHLTRLFRQATGLSVGDYLTQLRIETATRALREGEKVSNVVQLVGLNSENQLRRLFQRRLGRLPSDFQ